MQNTTWTTEYWYSSVHSLLLNGTYSHSWMCSSCIQSGKAVLCWSQTDITHYIRQWHYHGSFCWDWLSFQCKQFSWACDCSIQSGKYCSKQQIFSFDYIYFYFSQFWWKEPGFVVFWCGQQKWVLPHNILIKGISTIWDQCST